MLKYQTYNGAKGGLSISKDIFLKRLDILQIWQPHTSAQSHLLQSTMYPSQIQTYKSL